MEILWEAPFLWKCCSQTFKEQHCWYIMLEKLFIFISQPATWAIQILMFIKCTMWWLIVVVHFVGSRITQVMSLGTAVRKFLHELNWSRMTHSGGGQHHSMILGSVLSEKTEAGGSPAVILVFPVGRCKVTDCLKLLRPWGPHLAGLYPSIGNPNFSYALFFLFIFGHVFCCSIYVKNCEKTGSLYV